MQYFNAVEAARALNIGDKTIRRWLKAGKFPSAIVKPNGEYAIPETEINLLKEEMNRYPSTGHDQSSVFPDSEVQKLYLCIGHVARMVEGQQQRIAELEQRVANLESSQSVYDAQHRPSPSSTTKDTRVPPKGPVNTTTTSNNMVLPPGCILASRFAEAHGVNRGTFRDHLRKGLSNERVDYSERPKPGRGHEIERYLDPIQQLHAFYFWIRHDVKFSQCSDEGCVCHLK